MAAGCPTAEEIDAFVDGRLAAADAERIRGHLDGCADCRVLVGTLARPSKGATVDERGGGREPAAARAIERIDRYAVSRKLGAGGMGVVYLAEDPELKRRVVIKLLRPELVEPGNPEDRARLLREAQAMAQVSHPHVVPIYDVGVHADQVFLAMEFIDGADLAAWLAAQPRSVTEVVAVFTAAGRGLAAAHRAGLVHRDFKPHNVMVGTDGTVKVTDFGLARAELPPAAAGDTLNRDRARLISRSTEVGAATLLESPITRTGAMVGTPAYMAPEQILGQFVDARSDQFSFCVALYEALYGERPFKGRTTAELFDSTLDGAIPEPTAGQRRVPEPVRRAIRRGLSVEPRDRFPSMDALLAALAPPRSRRALVVGVIGGVALVAAGVAVAVRLTRSPSALCTGAAVELAAVWNPTRRQTIEQAFLATRSPMARPAITVVAASVGHYATVWQAGHREACEATRIRGEQTEAAMALRMRCLRQRRAELDALLVLFARPDDDLMASAGTAVASLTSPVVCDNAEALVASGLPVDPAVRAEVEAIEAVVAAGTAALAAHHYEAAGATLADALARAQKAGHKPLIAEVELQLGLAALVRNDAPGAAQHLQHAIAAAEPVGADQIRARAYIEMIGLETDANHLDEAERYAGYAASTIERLGQDRQLLARLDGMRAGIFRARGDFARAAASYTEAIEHATAAFGARSSEVALGHQALALLYNERRDYDRAFEQDAAARDIWVAVLGPDAPEVASELSIMSAIRNYQGKNDEALALGDDAIARMRRYFGEDSYLLAPSYQSQANILQALGRPDDAIALGERAVALLTGAYGTQHPLTATAYQTLGLVYSNAGRNDDALVQFTRALTSYRAIYGDDHPDVAQTLNLIGVVRKRQGRYDEALAAYQQARAIFEKAKDPGSQQLADTLTRIGTLDLLRARPLDAVSVLEQALTMRVVAEAAPASAAWTKGELARALWEAHGDRVRATALAREAVTAAEAGGDAALADEITAWLAAHPR